MKFNLCRRHGLSTAVVVGVAVLSTPAALADGTGREMGLSSFSLDFAASGGAPGSPVSIAAEPHPTQSKAFNRALESGSPLTSTDLLGILVGGQTSSPSTRSSLLDDATLTVVFRDHRTGQSELLALAECEQLDFDDRSGTIFQARANCDGVFYTYGVGANGLEIWRGSDIAFQLPLEPGTYALNDVPFLVQATD